MRPKIQYRRILAKIWLPRSFSISLLSMVVGLLGERAWKVACCIVRHEVGHTLLRILRAVRGCCVVVVVAQTQWMVQIRIVVELENLEEVGASQTAAEL
jgi:hypothetical protein